MIIIDTNVVSQLTSSRPDPTAISWLKQHDLGGLCLTAVTEAEARYGLMILPLGRRRAGLQAEIDNVFGTEFAGRVIPFGSSAARHYAELAAKRRLAGLPISTADAMIAAICLSQSMQLATRNVRDFEDTGVTIINPFD